MFYSPAVIACFDDVAMVRHSIEQSGGHFFITKDRGPFTEGEIGARKPSFDNLRRLADALETTVDYLMGRTDAPDVALASGDQLYRDFEKLTDHDRAIARDFMATLARRARKDS